MRSPTLLFLPSIWLGFVSAIDPACTSGVQITLAQYAKYDAIQLNCYRSFYQFAPVTVENQQTSTSNLGTLTITNARSTVDAGSTVTRTAAKTTSTAPARTVAGPTVTTGTSTTYISLAGSTTVTYGLHATVYGSITSTFTDANTFIVRTTATGTYAPVTSTITTTSGATTTTSTAAAYTHLADTTVTAPTSTVTSTIYVGGTAAAGICPTNRSTPARRRARMERRGKEDDFKAILVAQPGPTSPLFYTFCSCYATRRTVTIRPTAYLQKTTTVSGAVATTTQTTTITPAVVTTTPVVTSTSYVYTVVTWAEGGVGAVTVTVTDTVTPSVTITPTSTITDSTFITPTTTSTLIIQSTITNVVTSTTTDQTTVTFIPTSTATTTINLGGGGSATAPQFNDNVNGLPIGYGSERCYYWQRSTADVYLLGSVGTALSIQGDLSSCMNLCDSDATCQVYKFVVSSGSCSLYSFAAGQTANYAYPIAGSNYVGVKQPNGFYNTCPNASVVAGEYCTNTGSSPA